MAKILICIVTICLVQLVTANTAPTQENNKNSFTTVEQKITEAHGQLLRFIYLQDEMVADIIVSDSKTYAAKLKVLIDEIKEKAKSSTGELSESAILFTNKLTVIVQKLETPQMEQYRETLESSMSTVVELTKEFSTQPEPINDEVKIIVERILSLTENFAESVTTTVEYAIKRALYMD